MTALRAATALLDAAAALEVLYWQRYRRGLRRTAIRDCGWSHEEIELLRVLYPHYTNPELALVFARSAGAVKRKAIMDSRCEFKQPDVVARARRAAQHSSCRSWFRAGSRPQTWQPVGAEVVTDGYLKRKISDDRSRPSRFNWQFVHVLVWEQHHGPVPPGHNVVFRNGNKEDIRIENLECISNAELMRRNTCHRYGPEIARLVQLKGALTRKINYRSKEI